MKTMFIAFMLLLSAAAMAQRHPIERTWYNEEKTAKIRIFLATDGKYYGKIAWLKSTSDELGNPRTDKENPDKNLRSKPLMDLIILSGFSVSADKHVLEGGKVYDPNNGKTYCGKLSLKSNVIDLRGYVCSLSFLGRTSQWTLAE
jgi:uncharacterized protein (DUF2147 family)